MASYSELQAQIQVLRQQAEAARTSEIAAAKQRIHSLMDAHGLTLADLAPAANKRIKSTALSEAKYRDPDSGRTWNSKGRPPAWIAGKDPQGYRIK
ncbi:H-NS histone family protein [Duganella sp. FT134W]|uniref:H-NS histone family protein n=1 Tax=Duganella margarita TaxID=2692170 RepID=A0A7X4H481_9BURK|nr:H-NS histone family protein [Duganella margarita]MYM73964.1 H-NS histone family protein [Duganella margarita]